MGNFSISLGSKVKSRVSGFAGVITSRAEHLNGCNRYLVAPPVGKDGKLPDSYWFDKHELLITGELQIEKKELKTGVNHSKFK